VSVLRWIRRRRECGLSSMLTLLWRTLRWGTLRWVARQGALRPFRALALVFLSFRFSGGRLWYFVFTLYVLLLLHNPLSSPLSTAPTFSSTSLA